MKCDIAKERICSSVYAELKPLDEETLDHLCHCQDCKAYHSEILSVKTITEKLSQQQATLDKPQQLTNDILNAIKETENESKSRPLNTLFWVERILAAASVFLLIMFSYEQTVVTDKLIKLEEQMSETQGTAYQSSHAKKLLNYYPTQGMEVIKTELASRNIVLTDGNLASLLLRAKSLALSPEEISNRLKYQFVHLKIPNQKINLINAMNN